MAKWAPPHPAQVIKRPLSCQLGQRFNTVSRARAIFSVGFDQLTVSLKVARCSLCDGGYHVVNQEELTRHHAVLTEVPRYGE